MKGLNNQDCLILMAVYNGEKYLREQLDSILAQTDNTWELIAQDDGSKDSSLSILEEYAGKDGRIHVRTNESGNHGPYQNYNVLINYARSLPARAFYLFADQDDRWDKDKLKTLKDFFCRHHSDSSVPALLYGDMRVIDENGKVFIPSMNAEDKIRRSPVSMFFDPSVWGCNFLFNRALLDDILPVPDNAGRVWGHDQYFARWAGIRGSLLFLDEPVMDYRRYRGSVTSEHGLTVSTSRILRRMRKIDRLAADHAVVYKSAQFVLDNLSRKELTPLQKETVTAIGKCIDRGGLYALYFFVAHKVNLGRKIRTASHLLILISGKYKKHLKALV